MSLGTYWVGKGYPKRFLKGFPKKKVFYCVGYFPGAVKDPNDVVLNMIKGQNSGLVF
jgi:hypothetical protein